MSVEDEGRAGDSRCCCMIKFFRGSIKANQRQRKKKDPLV